MGQNGPKLVDLMLSQFFKLHSFLATILHFGQQLSNNYWVLNSGGGRAATLKVADFKGV